MSHEYCVVLSGASLLSVVYRLCCMCPGPPWHLFKHAPAPFVQDRCQWGFVTCKSKAECLILHPANARRR